MARKVLFTLCVDNYEPEITRLTFPLLRHYARKTGMEFHVITERQYREWPVTTEKFQVGALAREMNAEWAMFLDADALVHPETVDFTAFLPKDTVAHNGCDFAPVRWKLDDYMLRDGRNIGSCNWCSIASEWCQEDFWHPPSDLSPDKAVENIFPILEELNTVITPDHLVDDYLMSRNIARYGLKFTTLMDLQKRIGLGGSYFFWHQYLIPPKEKVRLMRETLALWAVPDSIMPRKLWTWNGWDQRVQTPEGTKLANPCPA